MKAEIFEFWPLFFLLKKKYLCKLKNSFCCEGTEIRWLIRWIKGEHHQP